MHTGNSEYDYPIVDTLEWMGLLYCIGCVCLTIVVGLLLFVKAERDVFVTVKYDWINHRTAAITEKNVYS